MTGGEVWGEALLHVAAWEIRNFPMTETTSAAGDGEFMILYFISSQFYSDSMNIKCNKKVIYSRREFCIGVQEKRICSENTEEKFRKWLLTLCCNLLNYRFCLSSGKKFHTTTGRGSTKISNFFHSCSYRIFRGSLPAREMYLPAAGWLEKMSKLRFQALWCSGPVAESVDW